MQNEVFLKIFIIIKRIWSYLIQCVNSSRVEFELPMCLNCSRSGFESLFTQDILSFPFFSFTMHSNFAFCPFAFGVVVDYEVWIRDDKYSVRTSFYPVVSAFPILPATPWQANHLGTYNCHIERRTLLSGLLHLRQPISLSTLYSPTS